MTKTLLISLFALAAGTVFAADAPAAETAPTTAPAAALVKHTCTKVDHPGRLASETQVKNYNRRFKEYGECIKKFVDDQNQVSKNAMESANLAINEYNETVKSAKDASGK